MIFVCQILRRFDVNSLYIFPPDLYTVATLPCEIQKSHSPQYHSYIHLLKIIFLISGENKLLFPYPPHLKNVTTLVCKMHNFFIWLKVCCIPPNVGGSEKNRLWCVANGMSGKQRYSKCSKWLPYRPTRIHASSVFATEQLHRPTRSAEIQPMSQRFRNSSVSRIGTQYMWKNEKDEKFVHFTR